MITEKVGWKEDWKNINRTQSPAVDIFYIPYGLCYMQRPVYFVPQAKIDRK